MLANEQYFSNVACVMETPMSWLKERKTYGVETVEKTPYSKP